MLRYCQEPGCRELVQRGRCAGHAQARERARPLYAVRRLYWTARWSRLRQRVLADQPVCCLCLEQGRVTPATDVDHRTPHRGNLRLFWDHANLQGLCHACHSRKTAMGE